MKASLTLSAIVNLILLTTAHAQVPQCVRVATGQMVDCYEPAKIKEAYQTLKRRGIRTSHGYIISIEMNRGKFESAKALADWIERGDQ